MDANAQIVAIDLHFTAELIFVALVEEEAVQQSAIGRREFGQDFADLPGTLLCNEFRFNRAGAIYGFMRFFVDLHGAFAGTEELQKHVFTDRVYEAAEAFRIDDGMLLTDSREHAKEGLLSQVGNQLRIPQPLAKLYEQKFAEVGGEVRLHVVISARKPLQVIAIERITVHMSPLGTV